MNALREWLDKAWDRHDTASDAVAREALERARTLRDDADGAEAVRLARHTLLGHLADASRLETFLAAVPRGAQLDAARLRAQWALATLAGRSHPPPTDADRWGVMADVLQVWIGQGRLAAVRAALFDSEESATRHADEGVRRAYAMTCNNLALDLRLGARGNPERDALMLDIAHLSRRAWARAGTWMNVERADYQIAMCHAAVGQGAPAVAHAQACLARCEAHDTDAAERFFAHECNVHAQRAAGDTAWAAAHRARMEKLLPQIDDASMRAWCERTLADTTQ